MSSSPTLVIFANIFNLLPLKVKNSFGNLRPSKRLFSSLLFAYKYLFHIFSSGHEEKRWKTFLDKLRNLLDFLQPLGKTVHLRLHRFNFFLESSHTVKVVLMLVNFFHLFLVIRLNFFNHGGQLLPQIIFNREHAFRLLVHVGSQLFDKVIPFKKLLLDVLLMSLIPNYTVLVNSIFHAILNFFVPLVSLSHSFHLGFLGLFNSAHLVLHHDPLLIVETLHDLHVSIAFVNLLVASSHSLA